jgi:hypothetical protein
MTPSNENKAYFASPLPTNFKWTAKDCSANQEEVRRLELLYGFEMRSVVGSLNYLANTAYEELYAIRKACKYMHLPGRNHFAAIVHLLHHLRCHPPRAIQYYHDIACSPLYSLLVDAKLYGLSPLFIGMCDSSFADADNQRSTGCDLIFVQGGLVSMGSFVPDIVAMSSAEAESNAQTIASMKIAFVKRILMEILFGNAHQHYTVPLLTDNQAAIAMSKNDRQTKKTRHICRRWLFVKHECLRGNIALYDIDGKTLQLADLGTKNVPASEAAKKLLYIEVASPDEPKPSTRTCQSEEG